MSKHTEDQFSNSKVPKFIWFTTHFLGGGGNIYAYKIVSHIIYIIEDLTRNLISLFKQIESASQMHQGHYAHIRTFQQAPKGGNITDSGKYPDLTHSDY